MLVAHYIGSHKKDTLQVRAGWEVTRKVQRGDYKNVTHCEAILRDYGSGVADIGSSSVRDGGVRIKEFVTLDPSNWIITDMPMWDAQRARSWFEWHTGMEYDFRGAWATVMPGRDDPQRAFCSKALGLSVGFADAYTLTPARLASACVTFGRVVTSKFFAQG